jgi:hypothetical protein
MLDGALTDDQWDLAQPDVDEGRVRLVVPPWLSALRDDGGSRSSCSKVMR